MDRQKALATFRAAEEAYNADLIAFRIEARRLNEASDKHLAGAMTDEDFLKIQRALNAARDRSDLFARDVEMTAEAAAAAGVEFDEWTGAPIPEAAAEAPAPALFD